MAQFAQYHKTGRIDSPPPAPQLVAKSIANSPQAFTGQVPHQSVERPGLLACAPRMAPRSSTSSPTSNAPVAHLHPLFTKIPAASSSPQAVWRSVPVKGRLLDSSHVAGRPGTPLQRRGSLPGRPSPFTTCLLDSQAPPLFCGGVGPPGNPCKQAPMDRLHSAQIAHHY
ncbi:hypothetical protein NDU88_003166 [Pleurodeles waltl]|uniref:Uncharacterized protein n=1 Tax=Pleurodeles waltl TaxID=8319 RepID=A0AAV7UEG7_PLEWA|nr:hypothetical protein NDU88_003166 [Pleurodeles waltl]